MSPTLAKNIQVEEKAIQEGMEEWELPNLQKAKEYGDKLTYMQNRDKILEQKAQETQETKYKEDVISLKKMQKSEKQVVSERWDDVQKRQEMENDQSERKAGKQERSDPLKRLVNYDQKHTFSGH